MPAKTDHESFDARRQPNRRDPQNPQNPQHVQVPIGSRKGGEEPGAEEDAHKLVPNERTAR